MFKHDGDGLLKFSGEKITNMITLSCVQIDKPVDPVWYGIWSFNYLRMGAGIRIMCHAWERTSC